MDMFVIHLLQYIYTRLLFPKRGIAKASQARVQGDTLFPSPLHLVFFCRLYRGGASQTPHFVPFVVFYKPQGLQW